MTIGRVLKNVALLLLFVVLLFPVYFAIVGSFMGRADLASNPPSLFPTSLHPENYAKALDLIPLGTQYLNSFAVSAIITLAQLFTAVLAAYALVFLEWRGKKAIFAVVLVTIMVPFEATVIPNYLMISDLRLTDTWLGLTLPFLAAGFGIFLMRQAFLSFPTDLRDAARIDGCGHLRFIGRVLVPLTKPSLAALGIYTFLNAWNMYFWPLLVTQSEESQTIQIGITQLRSVDANDPGMIMSGVVLALVPTLLLVLFGQRYIVRGLTAGAIR